jgi:hypothetical protein
MISCVMPTGARPELARAALNDWILQTISSELVILDNSDDPSFPRPPKVDGVRYYREAEPETLGEKRNRVNELARGELIAHWDDDDIHSNHDLVTRLRLWRWARANDADIVGYNSIHFYDYTNDRWWRYVSERSDYAVGTSLIYWRSYWCEHPYRKQKRKSDTAFVMDHSPRVVGVDGGLTIIATIHGANLNDRPEEKIRTWLNWHEVKCPLDDSQTEALSKRFPALSTPTAA